MRIYLAVNGALVIDTGSTVKELLHDDGTPFMVEKIATSIYIWRENKRIIGPVPFGTIFKQDGVTPAGANVDIAAAYILTLLTTAES